MEFCILNNKKIDLTNMLALMGKPEPFTPGVEKFWDDPYISQQMLKAHLDPEIDAASYRSETIDKAVHWLHDYMELPAGSALIDLGCGPGLYCTRFARLGYKVTGVDISMNSIDYAIQAAQKENYYVDYLCQDYLELDFQDQFSAAFIIYYDLGVLPDGKLEKLLANVARALKPGGYFIFDVPTDLYRKGECQKTWSMQSSGFWKPSPYLELTQTFHYEKEHLILDQYLILDEEGGVRVYRIWQRTFTLEMIENYLRQVGLQIKDTWEDLTGTPFGDQSTTIAVAAVKPK